MIVTIRRAVMGHPRLFIAALLGLLSYALLPASIAARTRLILSWDFFAVLLLAMAAMLFTTTPPARMPANAEAQEEGEWTVFAITLAGILVSLAAILSEFADIKSLSAGRRDLHVALVTLTLVGSWLVTQTVFALRYAHEFYARSGGGAAIDGGLEFPSEAEPDYWDFFYFAAVLGMTFQVSDVQITSRKFRRVATLHGLIGFAFNTVILALTVNIASGMLS